MSTVNVQKTPVSGTQLAPKSFDPFRRMQELLRWNPFAELSRELGAEAMPFTFNPAFDVKETREAYLFKADVPGLKEGDIEISVTGDRLTITGKRDAEKEEKGDVYYTYERSYGTFTRSFTLPAGIDTEQIHADLKNGVLSLVVPKKPEMQSKKISLKSDEKAKA